jgi:hypothetical protein
MRRPIALREAVGVELERHRQRLVFAERVDGRAGASATAGRERSLGASSGACRDLEGDRGGGRLAGRRSRVEREAVRAVVRLPVPARDGGLGGDSRFTRSDFSRRQVPTRVGRIVGSIGSNVARRLGAAQRVRRVMGRPLGFPNDGSHVQRPVRRRSLPSAGMAHYAQRHGPCHRTDGTAHTACPPRRCHPAAELRLCNAMAERLSSAWPAECPFGDRVIVRAGGMWPLMSS